METHHPSRTYGFVRGRQLEGTYPGDPGTGCWPITAMRVSRGWGAPREQAWPRNGNASQWPPPEPPEIDEAAKDYRIRSYQRICTVEECKMAIALGVQFL